MRGNIFWCAKLWEGYCSQYLLYFERYSAFVFFNKSDLKLHVCQNLNKYIKDPIPIENVKYALVDLAKYWVRGWQVIWNNEKKIAGSHASYISAQPCSAPVHYRTKGQTERCVRWALQCRALFSSVQKVQCLVKIKPQITILALTGRTGLKRFMSKKSMSVECGFKSESAISSALHYGDKHGDK